VFARLGGAEAAGFEPLLIERWRSLKVVDGLAFQNSAHIMVLVGGPGTGKTHLATRLGVQANAAISERDWGTDPGAWRIASNTCNSKVNFCTGAI